MLKKILTLATIATATLIGTVSATEMIYLHGGEDWTGTCATVS